MHQGFDDPDLLAAFSGGLALTTSDKDVLSAASVPGAASGGVEGDKAREEEEELRAAASRAQEECALLERAAHYALMMNADLQVGLLVVVVVIFVNTHVHETRQR